MIRNLAYVFFLIIALSSCDNQINEAVEPEPAEMDACISYKENIVEASESRQDFEDFRYYGIKSMWLELTATCEYTLFDHRSLETPLFISGKYEREGFLFAFENDTTFFWGLLRDKTFRMHGYSSPGNYAFAPSMSDLAPLYDLPNTGIGEPFNGVYSLKGDAYGQPVLWDANREKFDILFDTKAKFDGNEITINFNVQAQTFRDGGGLIPGNPYTDLLKGEYLKLGNYLIIDLWDESREGVFLTSEGAIQFGIITENTLSIYPFNSSVPMWVFEECISECD